MKEKAKIIIFVTFLLFLNACSSTSNANQDDWVIEVDGEKIWREEFVFYAKQESIKIKNEITRNQKEITDPEAFKEATKDLLVNQKVTQVWAKELGVVDAIDYYEIKEEMKIHNDETKEALDKGEVVYGLKSFDFPQYYDYINSNAVLSIKNKLLNDADVFSQDKMEAHYEKEKDLQFRNVSNKTFLSVRAPINDESLAFLNNLPNNVDEVERKVNEHGGMQLQRVELNDSNYSGYLKSDEPYALLLEKLPVNTFSEVEIRRENYERVLCITSEDTGYLPFTSVEASIQTQLLDKYYIVEHQQKVKKAKVNINEKVWKEIKLEE